MNYFDVILVIIIALVTIRGLFRGLITELMTLIALIFGFFIAAFYLSNLSNLFISMFPTLPEVAARIVAFITLFVSVNIIIRVLARILNKFASFAFLQPMNKVAGALFAFIKILLIISIVFLLIDMIPLSEILLQKLNIDQCLLYSPIRKVAPALYSALIFVLPNSDKLYEEFLKMFDWAETNVRDMLNETPK